MLFNSLRFAVFFPTVILLYYLLPHRWRWVLLLAASYFFYMSWRPEYIVLILLSTGIDYFASMRMAQLPSKQGRKKYLLLSLATNLGLLFAFKYFNFLNDSARALFAALDISYGVPALNVLLPVGISFYTFQTLSYTVDVYNGKIEPERHLGRFAVYVAFWPQLVAGPIERAGNLLPQFQRKIDLDYARLRNGLLRILQGFFKKLVIADRLAIYVNEVYNNPANYDGAPIVLATIFFAVQIYCDFSGYSDIAIGAAGMMGFDLAENFRNPYFATSVTDFWRRWHITLSNWFRDYVYIPLGGNRVGRSRWYGNLLITFLLSGIWHGAAWTFVIWGALHGLYIVVENALLPSVREVAFVKALPKWLHSLLANGITLMLVVVAWLFFRANSVADAGVLIGNLFANIDGVGVFSVLETRTELALSFAVVGILFLHEWVFKNNSLELKLTQRAMPIRWVYYGSMLLLISWFGVFTNKAFIYFQF